VSLQSSDLYNGVDNLEVMEVAINYRQYLAQLLAAAGGRPSPEHRTLDFGAGVGTYARAARALGYQVTCVELDVDLRDRLVSDGFDSYRGTEEIADATFDLTYSLNVLEHIDDDEAALRELYRVTAPGGRLLVYVPAFPILYSAMDRKVGHVRRYRKLELRDRVARAGFHLDVCEHADSLGFLASLAFKAVGSADGSLTERPVALYDRWAFPVSRRLDRLTRPAFGKNIVVMATRPARSTTQG
jgi:SAM-dependent methyltransferase